jgi:hypothetical protein
MDLQNYTQKGSGAMTCLASPFTIVTLKGLVWNCASDHTWLVAFKDTKSHYKRWSGDASGLGVILSLLQLVPEKRYLSSDLGQWAAACTGYGQVFDGIVVYREKLAKILELNKAEQVQVWDASAATSGAPCLGIGSKDLRLFLMGNDLALIPQGVTIDPYKSLGELATTDIDFVPPVRDSAQEGFELAMALDD